MDLISQFKQCDFFLSAGRRRLTVQALSLAILALLASGCASIKYTYPINERFSMNVSPTPAWFSNPKNDLRAAEKEVLQRRGRPDFVRIWWNVTGSPITSSDLSGQHEQIREMAKAAKKSWIYLTDAKGDDKGEEVIFLRDGAAYRVKPLSDIFKLICQYGDPSSKSVPLMIDGTSHETWIWMEYGLQIELVEGQINQTKHFNATGKGTYILK